MLEESFVAGWLHNDESSYGMEIAETVALQKATEGREEIKIFLFRNFFQRKLPPKKLFTCFTFVRRLPVWGIENSCLPRLTRKTRGRKKLYNIASLTTSRH